jgi:hypothetical protein
MLRHLTHGNHTLLWLESRQSRLVLKSYFPFDASIFAVAIKPYATRFYLRTKISLAMAVSMANSE